MTVSYRAQDSFIENFEDGEEVRESVVGRDPRIVVTGNVLEVWETGTGAEKRDLR